MSNVLHMHQRVRFTLTAKGKSLLPQIQGNGSATMTQVAADTYEMAFYDLIAIFGRRVKPRIRTSEPIVGSENLFAGGAIEILPLTPGLSQAFDDDPPSAPTG
jgi:hypothetical protein